MTRVLIIGAYGNFGRFITKNLAMEDNIQIIIAGRSIDKARVFASTLQAYHQPEMIALDIHNDLEKSLADIKPDIVIHTSGPFQTQGYDVAEACIKQRCHYIDLADGRDFVAGITALDAKAKDRNVLIVSGASSVPCLTSAIIDHYKSEFQTLQSINYGITTAQKTNRGVATTAAILGYTGKRFKTLVNGQEKDIYGWQDLHARKYHGLGWRLLGNCDVPDLALFPKRYPDLQTINFYAGLELPFLHISLWAISWMVRAGLVCRLENAASILLKISYMLDWLGTANSGFHMTISGVGNNGMPKDIHFELIARSGDGPYIPCMPAILLTQKLARASADNTPIERTGAYPCLGLINLNEYLTALNPFDIQWHAH